MHGMKNMSSMGLLWLRQWSSQIRKRHVIHSNSAQNSLLFCETLRSHTGADEDYALLTGERLQTFQWNVVACWSWRWRRIDQSTGQNVPDDLNLHEHRCENFTTNCCPETSARNYQSTLHNIPKWAQISFTLCSKPEITQLCKCYVFCYQHAKRMHRQVGTVFSLLCSCVCWSFHI